MKNACDASTSSDLCCSRIAPLSSTVDTSDAQPRRAPRYSRVDELFDKSQPRAMWTWKKVAQATSGRVADLAHGPSCAQSRLRLFGASEKDVRVTLFRDHHAWCPYCQKIWLWLEEKRVPYRVKKVTMFCYGEKESWYKRVVPSGMLPAVELDGRIVTESDVILERLEATFGPLVHQMNDRDVVACRRLERHLFGAWCEWLCRPQRSAAAEQRSRAQFEAVADAVEDLLARRPGAFFLGARAANGFLGAASLTPSPRPRLFMNSALRRTRILRSSS